MTVNTQTLPLIQARCTKQRKPSSEIMHLTSRRAALWRESERLDNERLSIRDDTPAANARRVSIDHRQEEIPEEDHAIMDRLSFLKPRTPGEISAMLRGLSFHIDFLANGERELEDEELREERAAKAQRIIAAVQAAIRSQKG